MPHKIVENLHLHFVVGVARRLNVISIVIVYCIVIDECFIDKHPKRKAIYNVSIYKMISKCSNQILYRLYFSSSFWQQKYERTT